MTAIASAMHYRVVTRDKKHRITREIRCHDLSTAYTVAVCMRKRNGKFWGLRTLPMPSTAITIYESDSEGRATACLTFPGKESYREAIAAATRAVWMRIPDDNRAAGASVPAPGYHRLPRFFLAGSEPDWLKDS